MIPTPIQSALATLRDFGVPTLLIGGQACEHKVEIAAKLRSAVENAVAPTLPGSVST